MRLAKGTHIAYGGDDSTNNQIFLGTIIDLEKQEDGPTWFTVKHAINFSSVTLDDSIVRRSATFFTDVKILDEIGQVHFDNQVRELNERQTLQVADEPPSDIEQENESISTEQEQAEREREYTFTLYPSETHDQEELKNHKVGVGSYEFKNLCIAYNKLKGVFPIFDRIIEETGYLMFQSIEVDLQEKIINDKIKSLVDFKEIILIPGKSYILNKTNPFQVMYLGQGRWFDPTKGFNGNLEYLYTTDDTIFKEYKIKMAGQREQTVFQDNCKDDYKLYDPREWAVTCINEDNPTEIELSELSQNWIKAITYFYFINKGKGNIDHFDKTKLEDWSVVEQLIDKEKTDAKCATSQNL